jgi:hypothetical protein
MTYYEERVEKAKALVNYAEKGFKGSVLNTAGVISKLAADCLIDAVPELLEHLLLEYEALGEVRADLERAMKYLEEANNRDSD